MMSSLVHQALEAETAPWCRSVGGQEGRLAAVPRQGAEGAAGHSHRPHPRCAPEHWSWVYHGRLCQVGRGRLGIRQGTTALAALMHAVSCTGCYAAACAPSLRRLCVMDQQNTMVPWYVASADQRLLAASKRALTLHKAPTQPRGVRSSPAGSVDMTISEIAAQRTARRRSGRGRSLWQCSTRRLWRRRRWS